MGASETERGTYESNEGGRMTRDEITRMWEKANGWSPAELDETVKELERFAELVAEATREHSAKMLSEEGWLMAATLVRVKK